MRIVLKQSMREKIIEALKAVEMGGVCPAIDYIEVTEDEAVELYDECSRMSFKPVITDRNDKIKAIDGSKYMGVTVKVLYKIAWDNKP